MTKEQEQLLATATAWATKTAALYKANPDWLDADYDRDEWAQSFAEQADGDLLFALGSLMAAAFKQECARVGVELKRKTWDESAV